MNSELLVYQIPQKNTRYWRYRNGSLVPREHLRFTVTDFRLSSLQAKRSQPSQDIERKRPTQEALERIFLEHRFWVAAHVSGNLTSRDIEKAMSYEDLAFLRRISAADFFDAFSRANLSYLDLQGICLHYDALDYANLAHCNLTKSSLLNVSLTHADLTETVLAEANLHNSKFENAILRGADLHRADLRLADLRKVDLSGANLQDAQLHRAKLTGAKMNNIVGLSSIPRIEHLDKKIWDRIQHHPSALNITKWHLDETTHCRAGWAIHLAGKAGYSLENEYGPETAGSLIYGVSTGSVPDFFLSRELTLADIRRAAEGE